MSTFATSPLMTPTCHQPTTLAGTREFLHGLDTWLGSDDGYSAGWSLQWHSAPHDTWSTAEDHRWSRWISRILPGLDDDGAGGRVVRRNWRLSQIIVTPTDITIPEPQPEDLPWGGTLGIHTSWLSFDNERLNAFQIYAGCVGPCAHAEEVQTFVHRDLGFAETPQGWDNQLANAPLFNVNYGARRKLLTAPADRHTPGIFANDLSAGGQVALGNLFTLAHTDIEWRLGWGLPEGFTHIPDPAGYGIAMAPGMRKDESGWAAFVSAMARMSYIAHAALIEGGETANGGYHPGVDYEKTPFEVLIGVHLAKGRFSRHLMYHYFPGGLFDTPDGASVDWINLSLEWRFGWRAPPAARPATDPE